MLICCRYVPSRRNLRMMMNPLYGTPVLGIADKMDATTMPSSAVAVPRTSLRHQATTRLREAITSGRFRPNERLAERELCELLKVSRTLVREALRQLEAEGLVVIAPNRGPYVAPLSVEDAVQMYEVRGGLEGMMAQLFAERASDAQLGSLKVVWQSLAAAYERRESQAIVTAKRDFYDLLLDGAQNEFLSVFLRQLHARLNRLRLTTLSIPGRADKSLTEVQKIVEAIEARDSDAARLAAVDHIGNAASTAKIVLSAIQYFTPNERTATVRNSLANKIKN